jgi:hypothetical protein
MILGWGIRLKYQQSLKGFWQNECVSYWLLLTIMTRRNREQAMSRGVSEETPELRSFSTDLLCEAIWKFWMIRFLKSLPMTRTKTRTTRAYVWLTPKEKSDWKTLAASLGMCLNDYIRSCVERRKIPTPMPEVNRLTAAELGHIGVNLNQQIRAMNTAIASGQDIPNIEESLAVVEKVYEAVRELQRQLVLGEKQSLTSANER